jgi:hypothetical protein
LLRENNLTKYFIMEPGIVLTDQTREIIGSYLEKQRNRTEKRKAKRKESIEEKDWFESYLRKKQ